MASITFRTDGPVIVDNLAGSGLGFYGDSGFGTSILVGQWNGSTYITNGAGTALGPSCDNLKWTHNNSGLLNNTSNLNLWAIPNKDATLNIRFTHDSPVQVQNARVYIYDRVSINNGASGVTTRLAEIIHPDPSQSMTGSGDAQWFNINAGVASSILLAQSPGPSGLYAGSGITSVFASPQHDFYLAISCSPDSIGSKPFGLWTSLEYL